MPEEQQKPDSGLDNPQQELETINEYDPTSTDVVKRSVDLQTYTQPQWGKTIQPISQDVKLMTSASIGTVAYNHEPPRAVAIPSQYQLKVEVLETPGNHIETKSPKLNSRKLHIILLSVILVLLFSGISFAAISWYQQPQKVVSDAIVNAVTAKTTIYAGTINNSSEGFGEILTITSKTAGMTGDLDASLKISYGNKLYAVNGSAVFDKNGDLYFMVKGLDDVSSEVRTSLGAVDGSAAATAINNLVHKIDGTWVKVSASDLKQYNAEYSASKTCVNNAIKKFKDDKTAISEVTDLYRKHQFIVVDNSLGKKDGNLVYKITSDNTALKAFVDGLKYTQIYKNVHSCDGSLALDSNNIATASDTKNSPVYEIWISEWSHQITKIVVTNNNKVTKFNATILPKFNQTVEIKTPSSSISLIELQKYITDAMSTIY